MVAGFGIRLVFDFGMKCYYKLCVCSCVRGFVCVRQVRAWLAQWGVTVVSSCSLQKCAMMHSKDSSDWSTSKGKNTAQKLMRHMARCFFSPTAASDNNTQVVWFVGLFESEKVRLTPKCIQVNEDQRCSVLVFVHNEFHPCVLISLFILKMWWSFSLRSCSDSVWSIDLVPVTLLLSFLKDVMKPKGVIIWRQWTPTNSQRS